jgi:hypothetical protein
MDTVPSYERVLNRIKGTYSSTYLTIISIIQGAAFASLGAFVNEHYTTLQFWQWILVGNTLVLIIEAWDDYMVGTSAFVWAPDIVDALLPFALGGAELVTIQAIGSLHAWLLCTAILALIAVFAFWNLYMKSKGEGEDNSELLAVVRIHIFIGQTFAFLGSVLCLGIWLIDTGTLGAPPVTSLLSHLGSSAQASTVFALAASSLILAFFVRSIVYSRAIMAFARGRLTKGSPFINRLLGISRNSRP